MGGKQKGNPTMKKFGLTDREVAESKQKFGDNSMTEKASESFWDKLKDNLGDPMIKILIVALLINVVLAILGITGVIKEGAPEWFEPLGIFIAICLATLVSTFSEYRNENAFQKLQEEASRIMCKVYRNGEIAEVLGRSPRSVENAVYRIRAKLRAALGH